jgi:hypothetical protein
MQDSGTCELTLILGARTLLVQRKREFKTMCYDNSNRHIERLSQALT